MTIPATRRLFLVTCLAALSACGGSPKAKSPGWDLQRYEGELVDLFDDNIDPAAVGLSMEAQSPAADPLLRPRAQRADVVARIRVQTVTRDSVGAKTSYILGVQVGTPTLMPTKVLDQSYDLVIDKHESAFGLVQSLEQQLRGMTFIGFIKRFAGDDGPELHWHLTADTEEVAQVIGEIAVLEEVAGQAP